MPFSFDSVLLLNYCRGMRINLCQVGQKKRLTTRGPATCVRKRVAGFFYSNPNKPDQKGKAFLLLDYLKITWICF